MMNKKAIAAFAAGATLLAGFAMATPAFAADKADATKQEAEKELTGLEKAQKAVKDAQTAKDNADAAVKTAEGAATKASEAWEAAKKTAAQVTGAKEDPKTHVYAQDPAVAVTPDQQTKLNEFLKKQSDVADANKAVAEAKKNAETAQANLTAAQTALANYTEPTKPADPSEAKLKGAVVETSAAFDEANGKLEKAYAKYDAAYSDVKAAQAKLDAANAALASFKTAHDEYTKADKVELAQLEKAVRDASADLNKDNPYSKIKAYNKAKEEFGKAFTAAKKAWSAYKGAFNAAKAKNAELVAGFALPDDLEPLPANYQPGVAHVAPGAAGQAGKPGAAKPGKPGAAAGQAGANGAAAAGSKTEVENKNGKDKRGNTHTGTGVGVTLTALAATMLAGMGAAVRKARH